MLDSQCGVAWVDASIIPVPVVLDVGQARLANAVEDALWRRQDTWTGRQPSLEKLT